MNTLNKFWIFLIIVMGVQCNSPKFSDSQEGFLINDQEYFEMPGLNLMVYHDYYAVGHQSGITLIQNGERVLANGDIRLLNQRRPYPSYGQRNLDRENNSISIKVGYPDSLKEQHEDPRSEFPDIRLLSTVNVKAEGRSFHITVDLDESISGEWADEVVFRIELFPGQYFDTPFYMDGEPGFFPRQANGPLVATERNDFAIEPLATGKRLVVKPGSEAEMIVFESSGTDLELIDERGTSNHGWFILRSKLKKGIEKGVIDWRITPSVKPGYVYDPVIQVSQVGYRPEQKKVAIIEQDKRVTSPGSIELLRINDNGGITSVRKASPELWGQFLRYNYARFDFTDIKEPGAYKLRYGNTYSDPFKIHENVYKRHVWQPTLEYYLPVQMCHMRVNELVRVWHGLCHMDDALMAPVSHVHFDGYRQGPSTLTDYRPFEAVPYLNAGGWHDAGDYDLRVESQANTVRMLAYCYELFDLAYDQTTVDQINRVVEIHVPDGKPDVLQQIEHGVLTILGGYKAMGRLYRGIICPTGRQYSLLGDASVMTDNLVYDPRLDSIERTATHSGIRDDRWVFTEENPRRELDVAACLATAYRSLKGYRDGLAEESLSTAKEIWDMHAQSGHYGLIDAAASLYISTREQKYLDFIQSNVDLITKNIERTGPAIARVVDFIDDEEFLEEVKTGLKKYSEEVDSQVNETPYGVPYRPRVWGAGWIIQRFGVNQYFLHKAFPDMFSADPVINSMNFVLGVHPGTNTSSFVSGVGSRSLLVAYGVNRADWSFIPGGSASGTALIRPDFPELKIWPFLWQQTEYVMGGGAMNFMFLVLATDEILEGE